MEAKALADSLVEAGIGEKDPSDPEFWPYGIANNDGSDHSWLSADEFISDWRIAGKCLEYAYSTNALLFKACIDAIYKAGMKADELPRAIVEAFCEARQWLT